MTLHGHIQNGVVVLDDGPLLPDGTPVCVEMVDALQEHNRGAQRQGGQYAGQIWMAPDFDEWPEDLQESLGMRP
jgi:hypothetical protein